MDQLVLSDEIGSALTYCTRFMPALAFLDCICGTWDRARYCAKHLARAVLALTYLDHLWTRGPGANGKDTAAHLVHTRCGGDDARLPSEGLEAPSKALLVLKGQRRAAYVVIATGANTRRHVYKTVIGPKGKLKARGLNGAVVDFRSQFLVYSCTHAPVDIDDACGGSARRIRILDTPFNDVEELAPHTQGNSMLDWRCDVRAGGHRLCCSVDRGTPG